jgi:acyl-homoserine lactone acylase PvdQ
MFPYNHKDFEYTSNIIKSDELKNLKNKETENVKEKENDKENPNDIGYDNNINNNIIINSNDPYRINENLNPHSLNRGSNNFVISGKFTNTGKPILVNDPHLMNGIPTFWYLSNMKIGNEFNFSGANHPGIPVYFFGTNSHISWGITNGLVDTSNVLKVKRGKNSNEIILNEKVQKLKSRKVKIYIDKEKNKFKEIEIYESEFGPVINGFIHSLYKSHHFINLDFTDEDQYYYILTGNYLDVDFSNGFYEVFKQKDIISFRESLKEITMSLNFVYIDV